MGFIFWFLFFFFSTGLFFGYSGYQIGKINYQGYKEDLEKVLTKVRKKGQKIRNG